MKIKKAGLFGGLLAVAGVVVFAAASSGVPQKTGAAPLSEKIPAGAIAFDYYEGHIYLDALICDTIPARLVFDTGATGLYVDSLWLKESGFAPQKMTKARIRGAGTGVPAVRVILDEIPFSVDTLRYKSSMTPILALKEILGQRIDGILGQQYLSDACVEIDLRHGFLRAVKPDTLAAAGFAQIPVTKRDYRIFVPMQVRIEPGHVVEGEFLLDVGSAGIVDIAAPMARKAGFGDIRGKKVLYNTLSGGIGGESSYMRYRAQSVALGKYIFNGVLVDVSQNESGVMARDDISGLIGNKLLERFDCVIDFAAPALWLRPTPGFNKPFGYISPGFTMIDRTDICGGWIVTGIYEGHAPEGLFPGDTVVMWDRVPVAELDINLMHSEAGRHRIGVIRGGEKIEYICVAKELL